MIIFFKVKEIKTEMNTNVIMMQKITDVEAWWYMIETDSALDHRIIIHKINQLFLMKVES